MANNLRLNGRPTEIKFGATVTNPLGNGDTIMINIFVKDDKNRRLTGVGVFERGSSIPITVKSGATNCRATGRTPSSQSLVVTLANAGCVIRGAFMMSMKTKILPNPRSRIQVWYQMKTSKNPTMTTWKEAYTVGGSNRGGGGSPVYIGVAMGISITVGWIGTIIAVILKKMQKPKVKKEPAANVHEQTDPKHIISNTPYEYIDPVQGQECKLLIGRNGKIEEVRELGRRDAYLMYNLELQWTVRIHLCVQDEWLLSTGHEIIEVLLDTKELAMQLRKDLYESMKPYCTKFQSQPDANELETFVRPSLEYDESDCCTNCCKSKKKKSINIGHHHVTTAYESQTFKEYHDVFLGKISLLNYDLPPELPYWYVLSGWFPPCGIFGLHRDFLEYGSRWSKCFYPITLGYFLIGWFVDLYALTCAKVNWLKKQGSITLDYPYASFYTNVDSRDDAYVFFQALASQINLNVEDDRLDDIENYIHFRHTQQTAYFKNRKDVTEAEALLTSYASRPKPGDAIYQVVQTVQIPVFPVSQLQELQTTLPGVDTGLDKDIAQTDNPISNQLDESDAATEIQMTQVQSSDTAIEIKQEV
eukprot:g7905.t1